MTRRFLFLQGGASPFFSRLADRLRTRGSSVCRVNFCAGDALFWRGPQAIEFGERSERLPAFLEETFAERAVTDLVTFGDCRPCHRTAIDAAQRRQIRVHVFEEGYLRPGWITLERDGVNGYSRLPKDGEHYRAAAARLPAVAPPPPPPLTEGLLRRTAYDLAYHFSNFLLPGRYPGYRNHRQESAPMEYLGWMRRFAAAPFGWLSRRALLERIAAPELKYFLFPLQLSGDTQIEFHSPFGSMSEAIDRVIESFARHAPQDASLLVKRHPLDTGWVSYARHVAQLAARLGISGRVLFVDGGDLAAMIRRAQGIVTVNSTVGTAALRAGRPVFAIGAAVYAIPGLTFAGPLEQFWNAPAAPDAALLEDFLKVLIHETQVRGNYYSPAGIEAAVAGSLARLTA